MMTSRDIWAPLAAGSHDAVVVVRTAGGEEVDVKSVRCYALRCVIETDDPVHSVGDVITPDQLSELLDANTASIEECILMLVKLDTLGINSLQELAEVLHLAESAG
jgi:hypothetical protein